MAKHRAAGRAQMRPLQPAQGTRRNSEAASSAVKVGVVGALATATIAVPLAAAAADQGTALPSSVEATSEAIAPQQQEVAEKATAVQSAALPAAVQSDQISYADTAIEGNLEAEVEQTEVEAAGLGEVAGDGEWQKPTPGAPITSPFGYRVHPTLGYRKMHDGVDFGANCGTPVYAAESGTVKISGYKSSASGNAVVLDHGNGVETEYFHLSAESVNVGDTVTKGQQVGNVGSTGRSTGCHLHFGLKKGEGHVDPMSLWR
ncbi:M23 family metallopeptidase [Dermabacter sp. Marseille-Q3180]|uniref:M23 family metallopeptidase n=1 Tax=Dermabacter sp. Marseille-Q3180 TaxID=2758090 RepID=UPI002023C0C9|nr:M23 family metallopeptidase [Dermabacter sp. Marseille-Q3180]